MLLFHGAPQTTRKMTGNIQKEYVQYECTIPHSAATKTQKKVRYTLSLFSLVLLPIFCLSPFVIAGVKKIKERKEEGGDSGGSGSRGSQ